MNGEEKATFGTSDTDLTVGLRSKAMDLDSGWLGKIFGNRANAPTNIAGFVAGCLILSGIYMLACVGGDRATEYWKLVTPLLTLVLGFVFGKNS